MATLQFEKIYHGMGTELGKMRMAEKGVAWKVLDGETQVQIPAGDIKWAQWLRVARKFQLRIGCVTKKDGVSDTRRETFDGFARDDFDKVSQIFTQSYEVTLETKDVIFKGWNWGATDFQGDELAFLVSNKTAFEVPLGSVLNSNIAGKTEVSLEFAPANQEKKGKARPMDELVEIRFYVPGTHVKADDSDDEGKVKKPKKKKEGEDGAEGSEESEEEEEEESAAQRFHSQVRERATVSTQSSADAVLVSFDNILISTPRGRYGMDMYANYMRMRGKTYDYKILYTSITRLFLLPKDEAHIHFLMGLEPPIRQGQTKYSYLVMQFKMDEEMEAELNLDEETIEEKYGGKLQKHYDEPAFRVVSGIFRALSGKKLVGQQGGSDNFGIKCNLKANPGELHLLDKVIVFVGKSPMLFEHSEISKVVFSRVAMGTARTFDFTIETTSNDFTFNVVPKDDFEKLDGYLKSKKIRVTNRIGADERVAELLGDDDDDEMQSVASSDDDNEPVVRKGADVDDEDSEEDEDFAVSSSDGGSPTESDSDEDSDASEKPKAKPKEKPKEKSKDKELVKKTKKKDDSESSKPKEKGKDKDKAPAKPKPKPKAKSKEEVSDSDVEMTSPPKKKKKPTADDGEGDKEKARPRPKPKPKAKPKDADAMDLDDEPPAKKKPASGSASTSKPASSLASKPKSKPGSKNAEEGPVKKKPRKSTPEYSD